MLIPEEMIPSFIDYLTLSLRCEVKKSKGEEAFRFMYMSRPYFAMKETQGVSIKSIHKDHIRELEEEWYMHLSYLREQELGDKAYEEGLDAV